MSLETKWLIRPFSVVAPAAMPSAPPMEVPTQRTLPSPSVSSSAWARRAYSAKQ